MTDTTNINSTIYNIIMGDRYLDGPLNLLPGKIIKLQAKKKTGLLQTTTLAIGIIIIFFGGLYLDARVFNSNRVVSFIMILFNSATLIILMAVLFILFNIILDFYRSRIVYRDVLEHIDELINIF
jgi:hypothetical protein